MIGWLIVGAAKSAARNSGKPGKKQEWQPLTKIIWIFFIFAIPIAIGGAWRTGALVILGLIVASVIVALVWAVCHAVAHRNDKPEAPADPLAEFFDGKEGSGKP